MASFATKSISFHIHFHMWLVACFLHCVTQKEPSGGVCVPVLCGSRCDDVLPGETVRYLRQLKICESSLLWRQDVDLMKLHDTRRLSLTLLRDGLLDRYTKSEHINQVKVRTPDQLADNFN